MENMDLKMRNLIFFDGVCHLCNNFVDHITSRDREHLFLFAPIQGKTAQDLLPEIERTQLDTVIFFSQGKTYYRSTAIIKILTQLGGVYSLLGVVLAIPSPARDWLYNLIANNRYSWFGKKDHCRIPTPEEKNFLLP